VHAWSAVNASVHTQPPKRDLPGVLRELAAWSAGAAALVYLTGALALQLRLGLADLPSSVAVPQLPREFLISVGLLIVAPAIAVAFLVWWLAGGLVERQKGQHRYLAAIVAGFAGYLILGALVVFKDPFPARVCLLNGRGINGVFIGETSDRTYVGDLARPREPRQVQSIPRSQIARVVVGGGEKDLPGVCGEYAP
jgi:hypothetical protein